MIYKAFISYSHAVDGRLAPALQSALHHFAKPCTAFERCAYFAIKRRSQRRPRFGPRLSMRSVSLNTSSYSLHQPLPARSGSPRRLRGGRRIAPPKHADSPDRG